MAISHIKEKSTSATVMFSSETSLSMKRNSSAKNRIDMNAIKSSPQPTEEAEVVEVAVVVVVGVVIKISKTQIKLKNLSRLFSKKPKLS